MVKLIRVKGDYTKDDKEIRNVFSDNVLIKPFSRIALRSVDARLDDVTENLNLYTIPAGTTYQYACKSSEPSEADYITVTPTAGNYDNFNDIARELNIKANGTLSESKSGGYAGVHNQWEMLSTGQSQLNVFRVAPIDAEFSQWVVDKGDNALTLGLNTLSSDGSEEVLLFNPSNIPLLSNNTTMILTTVADFTWKCTSYDDTGDVLWGFQVGGGNYLLLANNGTTISAVPAQASDIIDVHKFGSTVKLIVQDGNTGADRLVMETTLTDATLFNQQVNYVIEIPNGQAPKCEVTNVYYLNGTQQPNTLHLKWPFGANVLANQLGFTDSQYKVSGMPARLISKHKAVGITQTPGIMLSMEGLDLETYNGQVNTLPRPINILDVMYIDDNSNRLRYTPNFPLPLNIKNAREVNMRDIRLSFTRNDSGEKVKFFGEPIIVLEIYDPDEST